MTEPRCPITGEPHPLIRLDDAPEVNSAAVYVCPLCQEATVSEPSPLLVAA